MMPSLSRKVLVNVVSAGKTGRIGGPTRSCSCDKHIGGGGLKERHY